MKKLKPLKKTKRLKCVSEKMGHFFADEDLWRMSDTDVTCFRCKAHLKFQDDPFMVPWGTWWIVLEVDE